ncbi:exocyst complex component 5 isoform X2 [Zootermopsis nevadensis]|uniref:Exocyst complex component 5 n=1 Tax=Zootermopsis nevadensis TaxID=136037 RepID=A0A067QT50_ZOONE|nr:exocyst complex component 5 isoform X2 [Zootermopsis nevadensis]KDR06665.1 Exocyst complex component 5 [Zootermopsis nevadensis]
MMMQYMKELEQEPFDPDEFVERLAWRTVADSRNEGTGHFDPVLLHETFLQAIKDLQLLQERQQKKCERLEIMCREEENGHWQQISQLQDRNKASVSMFQELDERINYVATKVIHLGDQLESVNTPRSRAVEAQKLMNHFAEFLSPGPLLAEVFTDKTQIDEAADIIQKLHLIAQELPSGKFEKAKKKIAAKYDEIERSLIEEFVKAHRSDDKGRMKEIATILSHFKGYPQCIDAFIEQSQMGAFTGKDVFHDVIPLCEKNFSVMTEVFSNPDQVMAKFVLNIYHLKLQKYIVTSLSDRSDTDRYLKNLYDLYSRTVKLSNDLSHFQMGNDNMYLSKLTMNIFQKYLDSYISVETKCLKEKSAAVLHRYYECKNHQKKQIQTGGFQDLRRDLQAVIGTRANFNIAQIENYGGETFLSEEVAIALLQESKLAFRRCELLSRQSDMPGNALQIFEILLHYLMAEHLDYALELGLQSVPIPENKTQPQISFFDVLRQCNAIIHLLEKQFIDSLVPLVISTPKHGDCLQKKKYLLEQIEFKLDTGLDRSINAIVGWVKIYLQTEQKKTDFKPETDVDTLASPACLAVVQYVRSMVERIRDSLDGKNVEALMMEFGARFHRVIYEHLQQFQYNSAGAMCVICDVNEYRKCVKEFKVPLVNTLFDTLHALCNLLLVKPENLKQVCTGDQLAGLDRSILLNFIQLRSDYKTQKLSVSLKGLAT